MNNATENPFEIGNQVFAGDTPEDHDEGEVVGIDGDDVTVAWSGCNETAAPAATRRLRRLRQRPGA